MILDYISSLSASFEICSFPFVSLWKLVCGVLGIQKNLRADFRRHSMLFHRVGQAMLVPIFDQRRTRTGRVSKVLRVALLWWLDVLDTGICEHRQWENSDRPISGSSEYLGKILFLIFPLSGRVGLAATRV